MPSALAKRSDLVTPKREIAALGLPPRNDEVEGLSEN